MNFLKIILFPISLLYGLIVLFRNKLYDYGILCSKSFDVPIISVGNLSNGGTGKTPQVEYIIRLLKEYFSVAVLSKGYKRKTKGFLLVSDKSTSNDVGDEPRQYKQKFKDIKVAVAENRRKGIKTLLKKYSNLDVILLDDAFQHRVVNPGLSIILTDYYHMFSNDYLFPTGTLRESRSGAKRADIIIVTKTPKVFSPITRRRLISEIKPKPFQRVYLSYIKFGMLTAIKGTNCEPVKEKYNSIIMLTGIANPYPLKMYLKDMCRHLISIKFSDHHKYSKRDLYRVVKKFNNVISKDKIIVTTEKDVMRIEEPNLLEIIENLPVFYMPIEIEFHKSNKNDKIINLGYTEFNKQIINYVKKNKTNNGVYKQRS